MDLDYKAISIEGSNIVLIEDSVFHHVHNAGDFNLYMVCILAGGHNH